MGLLSSSLHSRAQRNVTRHSTAQHCLALLESLAHGVAWQHVAQHRKHGKAAARQRGGHANALTNRGAGGGTMGELPTLPLRPAAQAGAGFFPGGLAAAHVRAHARTNSRPSTPAGTCCRHILTRTPLAGSNPRGTHPCKLAPGNPHTRAPANPRTCTRVHARTLTPGNPHTQPQLTCLGPPPPRAALPGT